MRPETVLDWIAFVFLIVGAFSWGYFVTDANILDLLLERIWDPLDDVVFILIAASGVYWILRVFTSRPGRTSTGQGSQIEDASDARRPGGSRSSLMYSTLDRVGVCVLTAVTLCASVACRSPERPDAGNRAVTIYVSTDRVFSEPVLREYERRTGVRVNAVYDTEETKSTGLANRLLAEKARPQADVFWSNEPVRTLVLKSRDVLAPYRSPSAEGISGALVDPEGYWTGFSARMRVIAYNTKLVTREEAPQSVFDLADPKWKGQVAMADPRFGSTSFHVAALYVLAGDEKMDDFFRRLRANGVRVVDGNSVVRDLVARGEVKVGLTDTDDVNVAVENGLPVDMVLPDKDGLGVPVMPNMVSLIDNAPRPDEGRQLIDYLLSPDVERQLAESEAVQIPLHPGVPGPKNLPAIDTFKPMTLDFARAAARVEEVTERLARILGL